MPLARKLVEMRVCQITGLPRLRQSSTYALLLNCSNHVKVWMFGMTAAIPRMSAPLTFYGQQGGARCSFATPSNVLW
jgi:hypothetical protein